MSHTCPVCGYAELHDAPWTDNIPSDEICPRCKTQFGYDDAIGLTDQSALIARHAELREVHASNRAIVSAEADRAPSVLPAYVHPAGVHRDVFRAAVTAPDLEGALALAREHEQLLTADHIEAIGDWIQRQPDDRPATSLARDPELEVYLRQVAAAAILHRNRSMLTPLVKAGMVMGAWITAPQENPAKHLLPARELAKALFDQPTDALRRAASEIGPVSKAALEAHLDSVLSLPELHLVEHRPSGSPILEPSWHARTAAEYLNIKLIWLTYPKDRIAQRDAPWVVPDPAYLPPAPAEPIDDINDFFRDVRQRDRAEDVAHDMGLSDFCAWIATSYWSNETHPDPHAPSEIPAGWALVLRGGVPQLARVIRPASAA